MIHTIDAASHWKKVKESHAENCAIWWEEEKSNLMWSGAISNLKWEELWPEAKDSLLEIYYAAINLDSHDNIIG